jgi:hypothetical protein
MLEAVGERLSLGLEFNPTMLELTMACVIDCLPIVINNKVGDVDLVLR